MNTRSLRTFLHIAKVESFATAARQLGMTLAAVSMQMKVLEDNLQVALFDRSFRPPRLTAEGRSIIAHVRAIVAAEDELRDHCGPSDQLRGRFRIGFVGTASVRLLPGFLKTAFEQTPEAQFDIETGTSAQLEQRLSSGQLDAAVVSASRDEPAALRYDVLATEPLRFAVPTGRAETSAAELFGVLPFLQFTPDSGVGHQIARHVTGYSSYQEDSAIFLDSVEAIMECVKQAIGFTLLPQPDIERYTDDRARFLPEEPKTPVRALVLATLANAPQRTTRMLLRLFNTDLAGNKKKPG